MVNKGLIWVFVQENCLPGDGPHVRWARLAKHLVSQGYAVVVFAGSAERSTGKQKITDGSAYTIDSSLGFPFVYFRVCQYGGSMKKRLWAIVQFHSRIMLHYREFAHQYGEPDIIIGSSCYPLSPTLAVSLARKYKARSICETRDLWPLSLEDYGIIKRGGIIAKCMYRLEGYNYEHANALVFTMPGGKKYIADHELDIAHGGSVDLCKVFHISNGIDLDEFARNRGNTDNELTVLLQDEQPIIMYAGSVNKANDIGYLVDTAAAMHEFPARFVVFGDGDCLEPLKDRADSQGLSNIAFLGRIDNRCIPCALDYATICVALMNKNAEQGISQYGTSNNKVFDYLASGKPVFTNLSTAYPFLEEAGCGREGGFSGPAEFASALKEALGDSEALRNYGEHSRILAKEYSYKRLAEKYGQIFELLENE